MRCDTAAVEVSSDFARSQNASAADWLHANKLVNRWPWSPQIYWPPFLGAFLIPESAVHAVAGILLPRVIIERVDKCRRQNRTLHYVHSTQ